MLFNDVSLISELIGLSESPCRFYENVDNSYDSDDLLSLLRLLFLLLFLNLDGEVGESNFLRPINDLF